MSYTLSRLTRTLQGYFRIGTFRLKDLSGVLSVRNGADSADAAVRAANLQLPNGAYKATVQAPTLGADITFTLPATAGANGQALVSNGSGGHTYVTIDGASNTVKMEQQAFTQASSSPIAIGTLPAGITVTEIAVNVTSAASAGAPTVQVVYGAGNTVLADTTDSDLRTTGVYIIPMQETVAGAEAFKVLLTPDGQTFAGTVYLSYAIPA